VALGSLLAPAQAAVPSDTTTIEKVLRIMVGPPVGHRESAGLRVAQAQGHPKHRRSEAWEIQDMRYRVPPCGRLQGFLPFLPSWRKNCCDIDEIEPRAAVLDSKAEMPLMIDASTSLDYAR
jgi:hypothetical protein